MSGDLLTASDYVPLVNLVSIFFQIRDDYMNLQSTEVGVAILESTLLDERESSADDT